MRDNILENFVFREQMDGVNLQQTFKIITRLAEPTNSLWLSNWLRVFPVIETLCDSIML